LVAVAVAVEPLRTTLPKRQGLMAAMADQARVAVHVLSTAAVQTTPICNPAMEECWAAVAELHSIAKAVMVVMQAAAAVAVTRALTPNGVWAEMVWSLSNTKSKLPDF
tara:strand:- start:301 stop:624 length:324 start_codon:yes stop_codon:yes gene_type:complete